MMDENMNTEDKIKILEEASEMLRKIDVSTIKRSENAAYDLKIFNHNHMSRRVAGFNLIDMIGRTYQFEFESKKYEFEMEAEYI